MKQGLVADGGLERDENLQNPPKVPPLSKGDENGTSPHNRHGSSDFSGELTLLGKFGLKLLTKVGGNQFVQPGSFREGQV